MSRRPSYSGKARERIWDKARGGKPQPDCNIPFCGTPITVGQRWVVSHFPVPYTHGGTEVGCAHARCNAIYWAEHEAPKVAKGKRQRRKHVGAFRSRQPMRFGRDDKFKRTIDGKIIPRQTLRQKMAAMGLIHE